MSRRIFFAVATVALLPCLRPVFAAEIHPFESAPIPATEAATATLFGRVHLPAPEGTPVVNQRYQLVIENGVARMSPPQAVVYVEGRFPASEAAAATSHEPAATSPEIVQRDLTFHPQLLPVRVGARVYFPNQDNTYHNVFSFSPAKRFDLGRYRADDPEVPSQIFDRVGLVTLRCDIHEHMRAAILVLDTPHFTVTAPDGSFRLPGLPPGRHMVKVWLDSRTTRELSVELEPGKELHVELP